MPMLKDDFEPYPHDSMPGNPGKYPWDQWLDGRCREFYKAEDFDGSLTSFISSAQRAAKIRGLYLRSSRSKDLGAVRLQASPQPFPSTRKLYETA